MAGLAYLYQGEEISFDGDEFVNPQYGTARINMNVSGSKAWHGLTSDVSASKYCSLKFKIGESTARIGMSRTRSRAPVDDLTETWSGTGYLSRTGTIASIHASTTAYTGSYSKSAYSSESYARADVLVRVTSAGYYTLTGETGTMTSSSNTSRTSEVSASNTTSYVTGTTAVYYPYNSTTTYQTRSGSGSTYRTYSGMTSTTKQSGKSVAGNFGTSRSITTLCSITYGQFETAEIPAWTETLTATYETLHNYNL